LKQYPRKLVANLRCFLIEGASIAVRRILLKCHRLTSVTALQCCFKGCAALRINHAGALLSLGEVMKWSEQRLPASAGATRTFTFR
jgi:hypothetical protein